MSRCYSAWLSLGALANVQYVSLVLPTLPYLPLGSRRFFRGRRPGKKSGTTSGVESAVRVVWNATLRRVRAWLCPWARLHLYWRRWSSAAPPPELAALLAHLAASRPLDVPT
jgi:hypothetical protein